jgi:2'-hydroxyisoflavone reductase
VRAAATRGHQLSVFSRGKDAADLPAGVERLLGDRNGDLESIKNRDWDAVLDLATFGPLWVRTLGQGLKGRVKHYTFISSVAAYQQVGRHEVLTERSPVRAYEGADPYAMTSPRSSGDVNEYGALKVLCEREAEQQFPGRALILRPGYIVGPEDRSAALTYWAARVQKGGEMLVAGDPALPLQFIDVRDLAEWSIRMVETTTTGLYNTVGPTTSTTFGQFMGAVCAAAPTPPRPTWVPAEWLSAQKDKARFDKLLFWTFEPEAWAWSMQMNINRALKHGFTSRPMSTTLAYIADWYEKQPAERQAQLLAILKEKPDGAGFDTVPVSWPDYLASEQETLAAWHARQAGKGA